MTNNVASDDGADTDDDNDYKYYSISEQQCWYSRWSPPKMTQIKKGWIPRWSSSELSDEMADLCKKLPIYHSQVVEAQF